MPQTARKVIFPSLTLASSAATAGSLSRRKSPIFRISSAVRPEREKDTTFSPFTCLALSRNWSASLTNSLAFSFSMACLSSRSSAVIWPAFSFRSTGLTFSAAAAWNSISWNRFISSRARLPVTASMRRTPAATENSLSMWKSPAIAVFSRWVPPQNSTL